MGGRPIHDMARLTVRVPRGHQGFWDIIRHLKKFQINDIDLRSNVRKETIRDFVQRLVKAGYVEETGWDEKGTITYRLIRDQAEAPKLRRDGSEASDTGLGQDHMWRAMKMLGSFTARDVSLHASTDKVQVRLNSATSYIKHLHRAGYLVQLEKGKPGYKPGTGSPAVYRLVPHMITGPLAPAVTRTDWVWDRNLRKVMGPEAEGGAQ